MEKSRKSLLQEQKVKRELKEYADLLEN